jgi:hypothetical protein
MKDDTNHMQAQDQDIKSPLECGEYERLKVFEICHVR